jgi:hypothetical protein
MVRSDEAGHCYLQYTPFFQSDASEYQSIEFYIPCT